MEYGFLTPLRVEYVTNDFWLVHEPLLFRSREVAPGVLFTAPAGFYTDFASVPRCIRGLISKYGKHARSSVLHDLLYFTGYAGSRSTCDDLFDEAMGVEGQGDLSRLIIYQAVCTFGAHAWNEHRKLGHSETVLAYKIVSRTIDDVRAGLLTNGVQIA